MQTPKSLACQIKIPWKFKEPNPRLPRSRFTALFSQANGICKLCCVFARLSTAQAGDKVVFAVEFVTYRKRRRFPLFWGRMPGRVFSLFCGHYAFMCPRHLCTLYQSVSQTSGHGVWVGQRETNGRMATDQGVGLLFSLPCLLLWV